MMTNRLNRFGYVNIETKTGIRIRGHEFHRSCIEENDGLDYYYHISKYREKLIGEWKCGLTKNNVVAGYPHIHFYSNLDFLEEFLNKCLDYKGR
jgi:cobyrinic acid a,c-diamide synthase